jgi:hypothetical protein
MGNWAQGIFVPKNPQKYVGKHKPRYRSGWEMSMMMFLDNHDSILHWASESIAVPYRNPLTGKPSQYIPDFFVVYRNKHGEVVAEVVEIKPKKETLIENKTSARDRAVIAVNHAKWAACSAYCKANGMSFRVINEDQIFHGGKPPKKR